MDHPATGLGDHTRAGRPRQPPWSFSVKQACAFPPVFAYFCVISASSFIVYSPGLPKLTGPRNLSWFIIR